MPEMLLSPALLQQFSQFKRDSVEQILQIHRPLSPDEQHQPSAIFFQPLDFCFVVRDDSGYFCPEAGRVVHLLSVAQFVDDDVVEDLWRRQEKKAVEIEVSFGAAASPAGFLAADRDAAVVDAHERGKMRDALRDHDGSALF